jgi:uncharacterized protein (TIGR02145 family)
MKHTLAFIIVLYVAGCSSTTSNTQTVTDINGNVYPTVQIGEQTWMAENLRTTQYADGTPIANIIDDDQWARLDFGAWAYYDHNPANDAIYGKLYNWYAVANSAGLCPTGWHVPTDEEWTVLSEFLGEDAGHKMKSTTGWDNNGNGSNASGFTGLPGGLRDDDGTFYDVGRVDGFWSSSEYSSDVAWFRALGSDHRGLGRGSNDKRLGFSVRCLRD